MVEMAGRPPQTSAQMGCSGVVRFLHIAPRGFLPMRAVSAVTLIAGKGIEGDRYMISEGFYSHLCREDQPITLFEVRDARRAQARCQGRPGPEERRRNVAVEGGAAEPSVGRRFGSARRCWKQPGLQSRAGTLRRSPARRSPNT